MNTMRTAMGVALAATGLFMGQTAMADEEIPAPMGSLVDTFTATYVQQARMPGVETQAGIRFDTNDRVAKIEFEPGAVGWNGTKIDLAGREHVFLSSKFSWQWELATGPTPLQVAKAVECSGDGEVSGAINAKITGLREAANKLDVGFSRDNAALTVGGAVEGYARVDSFSSADLPELEGLTVEVILKGRVMEVDAATGLSVSHSTGQIFATPVDGTVDAPGLTRWALLGFALLLMALGGTQLLRSRRLTIA